MEGQTFGQWLIGLRTKMGETQVAFAHRLHVNPWTISRWETDDHRPRSYLLAELRRLARRQEYPPPPAYQARMPAEEA